MSILFELQNCASREFIRIKQEVEVDLHKIRKTEKENFDKTLLEIEQEFHNENNLTKLETEKQIQQTSVFQKWIGKDLGFSFLLIFFVVYMATGLIFFIHFEFLNFSICQIFRNTFKMKLFTIYDVGNGYK